MLAFSIAPLFFVFFFLLKKGLGANNLILVLAVLLVSIRAVFGTFKLSKFRGEEIYPKKLGLLSLVIGLCSIAYYFMLFIMIGILSKHKIDFLIIFYTFRIGVTIGLFLSTLGTVFGIKSLKVEAQKFLAIPGILLNLGLPLFIIRVMTTLK